MCVYHVGTRYKTCLTGCTGIHGLIVDFMASWHHYFYINIHVAFIIGSASSNSACSHIHIACVCRLKEASNKKKKLFHPKSSGQKEELKYYDMLIRNMEALIKGSLLDLPPTLN